MSVSATEATPTGMFGAGVTSASPSSTPGAAPAVPKGDKEMFLQLLVAQLRYQDPSNPTDSSQFLAQSAQFTALEKMQSVVDKTQELLSAQMAFGASGLVGRTVAWNDEAGMRQTGLVNGVTFGSTGPVLSVGDHTVPVAQVQSVTDGT